MVHTNHAAQETTAVVLSREVAVEASVSDRLIDEVVRELNELQRGAALDTALRMGQLIVDRFYHGDLRSWRCHTTKESSFRKLAARSQSDLRVSPTGLYRAVALYELVERLKLRSLRHLGVTHLRLVLGLPEDEQRRLIGQAEAAGWQSDQLEQEASRIRGKLPRRTGRTAVPIMVRIVREIAQLSQRARGMGPDELALLSPENLRAIHQALESVKQDMENVQRSLLGRRTAARLPSALRAGAA